MRVSRGSGVWKAMPAIWVALAGCAVVPSADDTREPTQPGSSDVSDEATRDTHVEQDRLGFDHCLQMRHSNTDIPHELHDGDTVATGDRVLVTVMTSKYAHLYLAFCSHHKLTIYPSQHGVSTRAGSLACLPECDRPMIFDDDPGPEVLYLIVSQLELWLPDPKLVKAIGNTDLECDTALDAEFGGSIRVGPPQLTSENIGHGEVVPKKVAKKPGRPLEHIRRGKAVAKKPKPQPRLPEVKESFTSTGKQGASSAAPPPPDPDFLRSPGQIVWYENGLGDSREVIVADAEGIAVVRYGFTHVASTSPP